MNTKQPLIGLASAFLVAAHSLQADQLTRLTDFGLPRSSNPTRLVDVNGTLFFFVPTHSGNRSRLRKTLSTESR